MDKRDDVCNGVINRINRNYQVAMKLLNYWHSDYRFTRTRSDKERLYVFPDNVERSSGSCKVPDKSSYSIRFGKTDAKRTSNGHECIRGLNNSMPLTVFKTNKVFWCDDDFDEFKKYIDDDVKEIKRICNECGYKEIVFPHQGILNGLQIVKSPKVYMYMVKKEMELKKFKPKEKGVDT